ncbi:uncharacterized protein LOC144545048 [Carex rostrata]
MSSDAIQLEAEISTSTETIAGDQELVEEMDDSQELVDEWVVEIEGHLENPDNSRATRHPSMDSYREEYPSIIGNWKCWDDFGASFLPENLKWIFVASMKHYFGLNVRSYLVYMQDKVDLAWSYYRGVDQFRTAENSKRFIEHLLVHSCFLIFGMILLSGKQELKDIWLEIINKDNPKGLSDKDIQNMIDFITLELSRTRRYMMTMNYQMPWFVIEAVYAELSNMSKYFVTPTLKIAYLFCDSFKRTSLNKIDGGGTVPEDGFKHLLHICHWSRTTDGMYVVDESITKSIGHFYIPSATELQLSQTVFINSESASIDVSYRDGRISGVLQLTPWHLFNDSPKFYEILLRFEGLYGLRCGLPFSSYVTCMANLVKTEEDVKVLRANDIIPGTSFDDKNVLLTVHELKTLINDTIRMPNELFNLEKKVMAHHKKSVYRVIGEFKKRYCSNTWIIISVIAGILLFALTFIQTIYGTLSYYKQ